MPLSKHSLEVWQRAQVAEKGHWAELWLDANSKKRQNLIEHEAAKCEFIFQQLLDYFMIEPETDWAELNVLDVGCGPLSLIAKKQLGKTRSGVEPLHYPDWVYKEYRQQDFKVYEMPFEELKANQKFDIVIFYNALQHFADLDMMAQTCQKILVKNGKIYLSEYLKVPINEAHIQYLEANSLDELFTKNGLVVDSAILPSRLPGLVERPDGSPIDLYIAKLTLG